MHLVCLSRVVWSGSRFIAVNKTWKDLLRDRVNNQHYLSQMWMWILVNDSGVAGFRSESCMIASVYRSLYLFTQLKGTGFLLWFVQPAVLKRVPDAHTHRQQEITLWTSPRVRSADWPKVNSVKINFQAAGASCSAWSRSHVDSATTWQGPHWIRGLCLFIYTSSTTDVFVPCGF